MVFRVYYLKQNLMLKNDLEIREINTFEGFDACRDLQRKVFGFAESEVSPRRYLVVAKRSGGFTLGAFDGEKLAGFVITVPAFSGTKRIFYSHMAGVLPEYQSFGIGTKLKWAQRDFALRSGVEFIKWTFHPAQARNAFFNLEKLGAVIKNYIPNFYGAGFSNSGVESELESDRVYADWELKNEKVNALSENKSFKEYREIIRTIEIPKDWNSLLISDQKTAKNEQNRIRKEFQNAFSEGLICTGFERNGDSPKYLLCKV